MRYLLDTHTFLWFITADEQISHEARKLIENGENDIDRLMIVQAMTRNVPVIGNDIEFRKYPVDLVW
jgi:PIN domain nuclease of toxin-antitoxin system